MPLGEVKEVIKWFVWLGAALGFGLGVLAKTLIDSYTIVTVERDLEKANGKLDTLLEEFKKPL